MATPPTKQPSQHHHHHTKSSCVGGSGGKGNGKGNANGQAPPDVPTSATTTTTTTTPFTYAAVSKGQARPASAASATPSSTNASASNPSPSVNTTKPPVHPSSSSSSSKGPLAKGNRSSTAITLPSPSSPSYARQKNRMLYILANMVGCNVKATTKSGLVYEGICESFNQSEFEVSLHYARLINEPPLTAAAVAKGAKSSASKEVIPKLLISRQDLIAVSCSDMDFDSVAQGPEGFRTDAAISSANANGAPKEKVLQRWEPEPSADLQPANVSLDLKRSAHGKWDQFQANQKLFGVTTDFDENLYTVELDKSDPNYRRKEAEAARIAREIEQMPTTNSHIAEERGILAPQEDSMNEEEKYSSVLNMPSSTSGKYIPPSSTRNTRINNSAPGPSAGNKKVAAMTNKSQKTLASPSVSRSAAKSEQPAAASVREPASNTALPASTPQNHSTVSASSKTAPASSSSSASANAATRTELIKQIEDSTDKKKESKKNEFKEFSESLSVKLKSLTPEPDSPKKMAAKAASPDRPPLSPAKPEASLNVKATTATTVAPATTTVPASSSVTYPGKSAPATYAKSSADAASLKAKEFKFNLSAAEFKPSQPETPPVYRDMPYGDIYMAPQYQPYGYPPMVPMMGRPYMVPGGMPYPMQQYPQYMGAPGMYPPMPPMDANAMYPNGQPMYPQGVMPTYPEMQPFHPAMVMQPGGVPPPAMPNANGVYPPPPPFTSTATPTVIPASPPRAPPAAGETPPPASK